MRNGQAKSPRPTTDEIVREHRAAMRRISKRIGNSPAKARSWLIRIGILDKSGKRLAAKYR